MIERKATDCGYVCFGPRGERWECYAESQYAAKLQAIAHFKARKSQQHLVSVHLCERPDGSEVIHTAVD